MELNYERVLEVLDNSLVIPNGLPKWYSGNNEDFLNDIKNYIKQALRKQIATQYTDIFVDQKGEKWKWTIPRCPSCKKELEIYIYPTRYRYPKFCTYCGQKIDYTGCDVWNETMENEWEEEYKKTHP